MTATPTDPMPCETPKQRSRFNLAKWCEAHGFDERHGRALSINDVNELRSNVNDYMHLFQKQQKIAAELHEIGKSILAIKDKLAAIRDAATKPVQ